MGFVRLIDSDPPYLQQLKIIASDMNSKRRCSAVLSAILGACISLLTRAQPPTGPQMRTIRDTGVPTTSEDRPDVMGMRFARQTSGDCMMDDAKISVFSGGLVKFGAVVSSHGASPTQRAQWHIRIDLLDQGGRVLNSQSWDSPMMDTPDRRVSWSASGHFDRHLYRMIRRANISNDC